jgi:N-acetylmuramic acid 6-phosphate etherase
VTISSDGPRAHSGDPVLDLAVVPRTEARNPRTVDIDVLATRAVLELLHAEDEIVPGAVRPVLGTLAAIVDEAAWRIRQGGRVHYFGAGSSGRIAMLDAADVTASDLVFGLSASGRTPYVAGGAGVSAARKALAAGDGSVRGALAALQTP